VLVVDIAAGGMLSVFGDSMGHADEPQLEPAIFAGAVSGAVSGTSTAFTASPRPCGVIPDQMKMPRSVGPVRC